MYYPAVRVLDGASQRRRESFSGPNGDARRGDALAACRGQVPVAVENTVPWSFAWIPPSTRALP